MGVQASQSPACCHQDWNSGVVPSCLHKSTAEGNCAPEQVVSLRVQSASQGDYKAPVVVNAAEASQAEVGGQENKEKNQDENEVHPAALSAIESAVLQVSQASQNLGKTSGEGNRGLDSTGGLASIPSGSAPNSSAAHGSGALSGASAVLTGSAGGLGLLTPHGSEPISPSDSLQHKDSRELLVMSPMDSHRGRLSGHERDGEAVALAGRSSGAGAMTRTGSGGTKPWIKDSPVASWELLTHSVYQSVSETSGAITQSEITQVTAEDDWEAPDLEYEVEVRIPTSGYGLQVYSPSDNLLIVTGVMSNGAIAEWNSANPDQRVMIGDAVLALGEYGEGELDMVARCIEEGSGSPGADSQKLKLRHAGIQLALAMSYENPKLKLGIDLEASGNGRFLQVKEVSDGLVDKWNLDADMYGLSVSAGDLILEANGVCDNAAGMLEAIRHATQWQFLVVHCNQKKGTDSKELIPLDRPVGRRGLGRVSETHIEIDPELLGD